ncbi:fatty-acid amide hydrolase 2-B-like [Chironomus tepperi]|uniref:fatty-acid amide hydrolase 2-B-like n=1 Tax=Chironomus tepperi TaxID=113505 RepID=UPI00391F5F90
MELSLRIYGIISKILNYIYAPFLYLYYDVFGKHGRAPPLKNPILEISAVDLAEKIRSRELSSEKVVREYIKRIREVEPFLNAVVENRFDDAIKDAKRADKIIEEASLIYIIENYPLLGVPFTVKESIAVKGLSHGTATISRKDVKADKDAIVVEKLRSAGAIPLLVSTTPEYCVSWECNNYVSGRTLNPYKLSMTPGGSSGGEAALNGAGASCFGIGSDIAGSIRVPSHFVGIFGHKPTPGIISIDGHFPTSVDKNFLKFLTIGPMCRYAKDLPTLTYLMSNENSRTQLRLDQPIHTKDIDIYYLTSASEYSLSLWNVDELIQRRMLEAVSHFKSNGLNVKRLNSSNNNHHQHGDFIDMNDSLEISICSLCDVEDIPDLLSNNKTSPRKDLWNEFIKSMFGLSEYTFAALHFYVLHATNGFIPKSRKEHYIKKGKVLREKLINKLGTNGVLFYPTFPQSACRHGESTTKLSGVMYTAFFNIMGFPSTHVPMGMDENGLPIGFQVIAAPYQDRNCFAIAREIEAAFGGWKF